MKFNKKYPSSEQFKQPFFQSPLNQVYSQMLERASYSEAQSSILKTNENDLSVISRQGNYQLPDPTQLKPDIDRLRLRCEEIAKEFYWLKDKQEHFLILLNMIDNPPQKMGAIIRHIDLLFKAWFEYALRQKQRLAEIQAKMKQQANDSIISEQPEKNIKLTDDTTQLNSYKLQVGVLQTELSRINEKLRRIEQDKEFYPEKLEEENALLKKKIEEIQYKLFQNNNELDDNRQQLQKIKSQQKRYLKQLERLDEKLMQQQKIINNHQNVVDKANDKANRSMEQAQMSREELLTVQYNTSQYLKSVQKTVEKVKLLQSRIDELTVKRSKEFDAPLVDTTKEDKESIFISAQVMENDTNFQKEVASKFQQNMDMYDQALQNAINTTKKGQTTKEPVHLQSLRYNYPAFKQFIEKKQIELETPHLANRALQTIFMGQLRAIMDAMHLQFQAHHSDAPDFPSFVYSWLSQFTIQNRYIVPFPSNHPRVKIDEHIYTFYLDLQCPRLDKVWEVVQFRQFLTGTYSQEQLYFYLHCRFLLRRGPWFPTFQSMTSVNHYTQTDLAMMVVDRFLENFDETNRMLISRSIKERAKTKGEQSIIQTGFVLQILLEMFRIELVSRYKQLQQNFPIQTFRQFHRLVKGNYPQTGELEVALLWREINLTGQISVQSFFVVGQRLFIKALKLPSMNQKYVLDERQSLVYDETNFQILKYIERLNEVSEEELEIMRKKVRGLGQEGLLNDLQILDKEQSYKMSMIEIGKSISRLGNSMHLLIKDVNVNGYTERNVEMNSLFDYLLQMIRDCTTEDKEEKRQNRIKERGIIRFQKLARKKLIKFYMLVSSILKAKK